jgi:acyl carrier protein
VTREEQTADITARVTRLITDHLLVDEAKVKPEAMLVGDLDLDSLEIVELSMDLEDEFRIEIADSDVECMKSVADVVAYVVAYVARRLGVSEPAAA